MDGPRVSRAILILEQKQQVLLIAANGQIDEQNVVPRFTPEWWTKTRKELPSTFRLPGKQPLTEQVFYALLFNFLNALTKTGVAVCGTGVVQPLAGRTESVGSRN